MENILNLEPRSVWNIFEQITRVPRPSKKEGQIVAWLEQFARDNGLEYRKDDICNIVICRPASPSMSGRPTVVLQSHMDMVCEKNTGTEFDFDKDPIRPYIDGQWVKAEGTTLGADDGIGMAAALAILIDKENEYPAIEALFTVDEETGLSGAFGLGTDMITGKYLINLDSEDEGEMFIGCAGGIDTVATFNYDTVPVPEGSLFFRIDIGGLKGGHSGDDINKGLGNSNRLLARLLTRIEAVCDIMLCRIDGGNLRNAIPREAHAVVAVKGEDAEKMFSVLDSFTSEIRAEFAVTDSGIDIALSENEPVPGAIDPSVSRGLVRALAGVPNGVLAMSGAMPGLVETSTNLASVKMNEPGKIAVVTSQRSSLDGARKDAAVSVEAVFALAGASVEHSDGYPGWNPDPNSELLEITVESYKRLFGREPIVRAIHAGLECGLFLEKFPHLQMVSFGPTIRGVHSPDERLEIKTVDMFWRHLVDVLKNIR